MNEQQILNAIDIIVICALSIFIINQIIAIIANYRFHKARMDRIDQLHEKYLKLQKSIENDIKKQEEAVEEIKRLKKLLNMPEN